MKKILILILTFVVLLCGVSLFARGLQETETSSEPSIVATTTWVSAFLDAAGVKEGVVTLAPASYRHPPEYELAPSQVVLLSNAEFFVFGGYEGIAQRVNDGSLSVGGEKIQIATVNSKETFSRSISVLAEKFGTREQGTESIKKLEQKFDEIAAEVDAAGFSKMPIICHAFLAEMIKDMGFNVVGVYGPAPPEAKLLTELAAKKPALIIDNWHNDVGKLVARTMEDVPVVAFINFPGTNGTSTLMDVLDYNAGELRKLDF